MKDDKNFEKQLDNIETMLYTLQDLWRDQEYRDHLCEVEHGKIIRDLDKRVKALETIVSSLSNNSQNSAVKHDLCKD